MGFLITKIWQILKRFSRALKVERKLLISEECDPRCFLIGFFWQPNNKSPDLVWPYHICTYQRYVPTYVEKCNNF